VDVYGYVSHYLPRESPEIDTSIIEATKIDGANELQTLRYIILPALSGVIVTSAILRDFRILKSFDLIYIMTQGGPARRTNVLSIYMYDKAFAGRRTIRLRCNLDDHGFDQFILIIITKASKNTLAERSKQWQTYAETYGVHYLEDAYLSGNDRLYGSCYLPILWLLVQSFKTTQDYMVHSKLALPAKWFYQKLSSCVGKLGHFDILLVNSVIYTGVTVVAVIIFGFMAGFAFTKIPNKATPFLSGSFIIGILLTLQSIMIPLFLLVNMIGLYNTHIGILIPYIGIGLPFGVYLSTEYIRSIPDALVESARIDGAKYLKIFSSIIIPMAAPVAVTVAIMTVTGTWKRVHAHQHSRLERQDQIYSGGYRRFSGALASDYGKQFAALVIGLVPMSCSMLFSGSR
jgi:raffinose/stachyose/melibiose transport system permease protein